MNHNTAVAALPPLSLRLSATRFGENGSANRCIGNDDVITTGMSEGGGKYKWGGGGGRGGGEVICCEKVTTIVMIFD
jgi:hypothetical protein